MSIKQIIGGSLLLFMLSAPAITFAQSEQELYKKGLALKDKRKNEDAFVVFKQLYEKDPKNVEYAHNLSFLYSKVGYHKSTESDKLKYYAKAKTIAGEAIKLDDKSAGAHYSYALALARENENAPTKQKISNAKRIKTECDKAIALDPKLPGTYHIMGRWHRTFAGFNGFKRAMVNTFYGGTPKGGTYKDALGMFQKAIKLEPTYKLHIYELAVTYEEMGKKDYAKTFVKKAMEIPNISKDDVKCQKQCEALLKRL
jgi:tetratricopeptide (TPR) repeat protein